MGYDHKFSLKGKPLQSTWEMNILFEFLKTPNELRESETAVVEVSSADCSAAAAFGVS